MEIGLIIAIFYGLLLLVFLVILIRLIFSRMREKNEEDFEDRPW